MSLLGDVFGFIGSGREAKSISDANIAAEHGVLNATASGQQGVQNQLAQNNTNVNAAGSSAIDQVNGATGTANTTLGDALSKIQGGTSNIYSDLAPNIAAGQQGVNSLSQYAASNPQFNFDPSKYLNSDAMKFEIQQGTDAIQNSHAAAGSAVGGNTLKDLTSFSQGTAAKYYDQAFQEANQQFNTNQNTTLSNLSALVGQGLTATGQANSANTSLNGLTAGLAGQQSQNTMNAGLFGGGTTTNLAQFLASQGLQGNEFNAGLGLQGSKTAGDYAVEAGTAHAAGINGQYSSLGNLFGDAASFMTGLPGMVGGGK